MCCVTSHWGQPHLLTTDYWPSSRCDRAGHFARDCTEEEERLAVMGTDLVATDPRAREYGLGGGLKCYKCSRWEERSCHLTIHSLAVDTDISRKTARTMWRGVTAAWLLVTSPGDKRRESSEIFIFVDYCQELHSGWRSAAVLQL